MVGKVSVKFKFKTIRSLIFKFERVAPSKSTCSNFVFLNVQSKKALHPKLTFTNWQFVKIFSSNSTLEKLEFIRLQLLNVQFVNSDFRNFLNEFIGFPILQIKTIHFFYLSKGRPGFVNFIFLGGVEGARRQTPEAGAPVPHINESCMFDPIVRSQANVQPTFYQGSLDLGVLHVDT